MGQQCPAVHIAQRVEPVAPRNPQLLIDLDEPSALEADRLEAQPLAQRPATRGDQQLRPAHRRAVLESHLDSPARLLTADRHRLHTREHAHTPLLETGLNQLGGKLLLAGNHPGRGLDHRHRRSQRGVGRGQLDTHDPPAEDQQRARNVLCGRRPAVGPRLGLGEPGDRRQRCDAARREDDRHAGLENRLPHLDPPLAHQFAVAPEEPDRALFEPGHLGGIIQPVDDLVATIEYGLHVEATGDGLGGALHPPGLIKRLRWSQQGLRGHAGVERAFAPDQIALHDRHAHPTLGESPGADLTGRAGADHDHIDLLSCAHRRSSYP